MGSPGQALRLRRGQGPSSQWGSPQELKESRALSSCGLATGTERPAGREF